MPGVGRLLSPDTEHWLRHRPNCGPQEGWPVNDDERQGLLERLQRAERSCCRWRAFALITTPVLGVVFVLALVNAITASLTLRERVMRERQAAEDALRDAEAARGRADDALQRSQQAAVEYERAGRLMESKATGRSP